MEPNLLTPHYPPFPQVPRIGSPPQRSPKMIKSFTAPNTWTDAELRFFRIYDRKVDQEEFFQKSLDKLREPQFLDPGYDLFCNLDVFSLLVPISAADHVVKTLMDHLRGAHFRDWTAHSPPSESITNQLAEKVLMLIGYDITNVIRCNLPVQLNMAGDRRTVCINVAILNQQFTYVLLCMEDKPTGTGENAFAQLMAYAIASFQYNNNWRRNHGLPTLKAMVFPALTLRSSLPVFYRITVTKELADAVAGGISPTEVTEVPVLLPPVDSGKIIFGMLDRDTRRPILKILENMKDWLAQDINVIPLAWNAFVDTSTIMDYTYMHVDAVGQIGLDLN